MTEPIAWMVYTEDGKSVFITDNPTDIKEDQRALPLYTNLQEGCGETCKRAKLCYACSRELGGLNPGDILRCVETDELCTVMYTGTSGKTLVKWGNDDFGTYTAEQIGELFWIEPKPCFQQALNKGKIGG
jgi:hypothetical protein